MEGGGVDAIDEDDGPMQDEDQGFQPLLMKCQEILSTPTSRPSNFLNKDGDRSETRGEIESMRSETMDIRT